MASQAVSSARERARGTVTRVFAPAGPAVLAAAIPLLFLHEGHQPSFSVTTGGTSVDVSLADAAVAGLVAVAAWLGRRDGWAPLRRGRALWVAAAALCALAVASVTWPVLRDDPYDWQLRLVAAAGFVEYALLAPAVPLLVRSARGLRVPLASLLVTAIAATAWGALQFIGLVDQFTRRRPGEREPSFVGYHDFAALSGVALVVGIVALLVDDRFLPRRLVVAGAIAGALGIVLSGAMTGVLGLVLAAVTLCVVGVRRHGATARAVGAVALVVLLVAAGTAAMRGEAIEKFAEFVGLRQAEDLGQVESYAQRTVLGYIGLRVFLEYPVAGAGFQASQDEFAYGPQLAAAHERFPDQPDEAFPSPERPWGVQNLPIQVLADWGVIGLAAVVALFALGLRVGLRPGRGAVALVGTGGLLVVAGIWNGLGIVPAIPLAAATWLAFGMVSLDE